jgi:cytochrome c oxidase subunit 3/cytochrome o ubiquinol oxidase subunit 3
MAQVEGTAAVQAAAEHHTSTGLDNTKMAMWTFLGSECLFFGSLITTFLLYRGRVLDDSGPLPHDIYDIPYTSVSSFILLMSSLTMVLALNAIQRNDHRALRIWLLATAFLGLLFVGGQAYEFTDFVEQGLTMGSSPAGSSFFVMTGFHGAHVTVGILMLLCLVGMSMAGRLDVDGARKVELIGLYWHFVDIVWIIIFTVVYLIPLN